MKDSRALLTMILDIVKELNEKSEIVDVPLSESPGLFVQLGVRIVEKDDDYYYEVSCFEGCLYSVSNDDENIPTREEIISDIKEEMQDFMWASNRVVKAVLDKDEEK